MCDIAGWVGDLNLKQIKGLFEYIHGINNDACGTALHLGSGVEMKKAPLRVSQVIRSPIWLDWMSKRIPDTLGGLLHARLATHGDPQNNVNNHPHISDKGSVLIHRGVVFSEIIRPSKSECDSEQILLALDEKGLHGISNFSGTASISYIGGDDPEIIWIYTSFQPIFLLQREDLKVFSSKILPGSDRIPLMQWIGIPIDGGKIIWGPETAMLPIMWGMQESLWEKLSGF